MDVDDPDLTFAIVSGPANGTLGPISGGSIIYTPSPNFYGSDSFTFKVSDGTAESIVAMVLITVAPVNDPPVANGDAYDTDFGTSLVVPAPGVLANDTDVEDARLSAGTGDECCERIAGAGIGRLIRVHAKRELRRHRQLCVSRADGSSGPAW